LTQVDGNYGNLVDAKEIALIARKYGIPLLLNSAYLAGRTRVNIQEIGADFIVISGHKSFGVPGHIGGLGVTSKWIKMIQDPSKDAKPWDLPARYLAITGFYASMETIEKRATNWEEEIKKANWFVEKMESIESIKLLGERPKQHDLILFDTPILEKISASKRKKGYFLAERLKSVGIIGLRPGQTQQLRVSTYGLTWNQLGYVYQEFVRLVKEEGYGI
jgi:Sep-tRNA:Cys-tRNA synthetase